MGEVRREHGSITILPAMLGFWHAIRTRCEPSGRPYG